MNDGDGMGPQPEDFNNEDFALLLEWLEKHLPITDEYEHRAAQQALASGKEIPKPWYSSQHEHIVSWFTAQMTLGEGEYTRKTPNYSAKKTYERTLSVVGLL